MARLSASIVLVWIFLAGMAYADESQDTFFRVEDPAGPRERLPPVPRGKKTSSGLRVDSREALIKGGDRGPAIVPGPPGYEPLDPGHTTDS